MSFRSCIRDEILLEQKLYLLVMHNRFLDGLTIRNRHDITYLRSSSSQLEMFVNVLVGLYVCIYYVVEYPVCTEYSGSSGDDAALCRDTISQGYF